jgi:hypothetical protein
MRWVALGMLCMMLAIACNPAIKDSLPTPPLTITFAKSPTVEYMETPASTQTMITEAAKQPTPTRPTRGPTATAAVATRKAKTEQVDEYGFHSVLDGNLLIKMNLGEGVSQSFEIIGDTPEDKEYFERSFKAWIDFAFANAMSQVDYATDPSKRLDYDELMAAYAQGLKDGKKVTFPMAVANADGTFGSLRVWSKDGKNRVYDKRDIDPGLGMRLTIGKDSVAGIFNYPIAYQYGTDRNDAVGIIVGSDPEGRFTAKVVFSPHLLEKMGNQWAKNFGVGTVLAMLGTRVGSTSQRLGDSAYWDGEVYVQLTRNFYPEGISLEELIKERAPFK